MKTEKIFTLSATNLKKALYSELLSRGYQKSNLHNRGKFLYAEGNAPYMLVAHLDTVHTTLPSIICYSKDNNYMMSPQGIGGDDRCGVYIILSLLDKLTFKPYVLFTMDEEVGGLGASAFANYIVKGSRTPDLKYIVEYDRKGNKDAVFYGCDNQDFVNFVEGFGFKKSYGTFSDISIIAPMVGVAAVNLSSGYYNPHTEHEYVSMFDMHEIIEASVKMLNTECNSFEYVEEDYYCNYYNKKISVTFVPAGTVYICPTSNYMYINKELEIAIDQQGKYYRYSATYGDLTSMYGNIIPVDDGCVPMYDADEAVCLSLYY